MKLKSTFMILPESYCYKRAKTGLVMKSAKTNAES